MYLELLKSDGKLGSEEATSRGIAKACAISQRSAVSYKSEWDNLNRGKNAPVEQLAQLPAKTVGKDGKSYKTRKPEKPKAEPVNEAFPSDGAGRPLRPSKPEPEQAAPRLPCPCQRFAMRLPSVLPSD